jgi:hypothetical protein
MPAPGRAEQFEVPPNDPLASAHQAIIRWVHDAMQAPNGDRYWGNVDLKSLESGRAILEAKPEEARRIILAALVQARFWDDRLSEIRAKATSNIEHANLHHNPDWVRLSIPQRHTVGVIGALIRRSLPFEHSDLIELLRWAVGVPSYGGVPGGYIVKALQRYAAGNPLDTELKTLARDYGEKLRASYDIQQKRWGTEVEQLVREIGPEAPPVPIAEACRQVPIPSPVGNPLVLHNLKSKLGIVSVDQPVPTHQIGPDRFDMPTETPLAEEHECLSALLSEAAASAKYSSEMSQFPAGKAILKFDATRRARVLLAAAERHIAALFAAMPDYHDTEHWRSHYAVAGTVPTLASSAVDFDRDLFFDFLLYVSVQPQGGQVRFSKLTDAALFDAIDKFTQDGAGLAEGERYVLHLWRGMRIQGPLLGSNSPDMARLTRWIGDGAQFFLVPGEHWSEGVNMDMASLPESARAQWVDLFKHALTATAARPSERWNKMARELIGKIGEDTVRETLQRWLPLVGKGGSQFSTPAFVGDTRGNADCIHPENANALRGFLWLIPLLPRREGLTRLVASVALSAYKKVPGVGPRAVKVGNAAIYTLSQMVSPEAMGQLAMLKVRVRFGTAQKEVEKAFDAAAAELNLPRDQVEEMSVPSCGLETVGMREESLGKHRVQLVVSGSDAELKWFDGEGKQLKSAPAAVKKENAETIKELQSDLKDVQSLLSAQRDRIDSLFLEQKSWPVHIWRERYIDHPLVGTIARRLIWVVGEIPITVSDGLATDIDGKALELPSDGMVRLWHPAGRSVEEVIAWRQRIEGLGIVQPFKQAHREIYVLTDAERRTSTYSNRFAAHILRQHQFGALCAARGWKNKLRLLVDDFYSPASRTLAAWNLRAEFWIEGIGDQYGQDTNDSGVFLRVASDQVRFYRMVAVGNLAHAGGGYTANAPGPGRDDVNEPLPLEQIPELVFSEIMRDVDLFVGVASVGNDPTWQDGGPGGRYMEYWRNYSFGELSATAVSRREILQRLLPRLKIAARCTLADRFLVVKGSRRTYKIHLGSGNILMEPNDQYLCIVPDARARASNDPVYLPFEGDSTLSIILSKAFLLAEDSKIKDSTINRQIDGR